MLTSVAVGKMLRLCSAWLPCEFTLLITYAYGYALVYNYVNVLYIRAYLVIKESLEKLEEEEIR